jgi:hypothetical protein
MRTLSFHSKRFATLVRVMSRLVILRTFSCKYSTSLTTRAFSSPKTAMLKVLSSSGMPRAVNLSEKRQEQSKK